jgi:atypical dual specificity phosphatase
VLRRFSLCLLVAGVAACDLGPDEVLPPSPSEDYEMRGFSWVLDDRLAGMPRPGGRGDLDADLVFIADHVEVLVSLIEQEVVANAAPTYGLEVVHLPVRDFTAPTQDQLHEFVALVADAHGRGEAVGVHCGAGLGRTGTFLSAYFVSRGMGADEAIAHVRALRPGSVETSSQIKAIHDFATWGETDPAVDEPARR